MDDDSPPEKTSTRKSARLSSKTNTRTFFNARGRLPGELNEPELSNFLRDYFLLNSAFLFSRNALVPSLKLSVPQQRPKSDAS